MSAPILITGGAGFIGSNLAAALNRRGERNLVLVDHLGREEKWRNLADLDYDDLWSIDDFRRRVRADALPAFAAVFHLGACSATDEKDADYLIDNNFRATRELCEWSLRHGARFVYASSAATYGAGEHGYDDDLALLPRLRPLNMYGYSKHRFDLWALRRGLFDRIVGLKYFNVFGPREGHKQGMRSVINKAYGEVVASGHIRLFRSHRPDYADGEQRRDFVYVADVVEQTLFYLDRPDVSGLFNCGTGQARSWNELARALFAAAGRAPRIEYVDMPASIRGQYQYFTQAEMGRVRRSGYGRASLSLEEAVADYVRQELRFTVEATPVAAGGGEP